MEDHKKRIFGPGSRGPESAFYNFENKYISELNLSPEELKMSILDLGGGDGNFASLVGDNVVVADLDAHNYVQHGNLVVTAKAEELPFADSSFELVISTQALPFFYGIGLRSKEDILEVLENSRDPYSQAWTAEAMNDTRESVIYKTNKFLDEALRVLKLGGKAKFAPIPFIVGSWEAEYYKILEQLLIEKKLEGKIDYEFVPIPNYEFVSGEFEIHRLEITKK